jgi:PEP-CTERM motif
MLHLRASSSAIAIIGGLAFLGAAASAQASAITFDFGSLTNNASNSQIQTFMNLQLPTGTSVMVTGAIASNTYNGDGHVTGPNPGATSFTLAQLDPANNSTFIKNDTGHSSDEIKMVFSGLTISSISFDFEIFPDGSCPSLSNCGGSGHPNLPDLTVVSNGSHQVIEYSGVVPGQAGSYNTSYTHSPASGQSSNELAPQLLGSSGTLNLPAGTTELEFKDWPATIAINHLKIDPVPEPSTMTLLASGLIGLAAAVRRRGRALGALRSVSLRAFLQGSIAPGAGRERFVRAGGRRARGAAPGWRQIRCDSR